MEKISLLEVAKAIQFNNKAEAQAIEDYTAFLKTVKDSELDEADKGIIKGVIDEIISDELNHQEKLQQLYSGLTQVEPNKD